MPILVSWPQRQQILGNKCLEFEPARFKINEAHKRSSVPRGIGASGRRANRISTCCLHVVKGDVTHVHHRGCYAEYLSVEHDSKGVLV